jgi:hypothetical protein
VKHLDIAMAMDVLGEASEEPDPRPRHFQQDVAIADDLLIGPFAQHRDAITDACDRVGINPLRPHRLYWSQYSVARIVAEPNGYRFDDDRRLRTCLQLSRLVHPTGIAFEHAGRLVLADGGTIESFTPARIRGSSAVAWVADPTHNWLDDAHIVQLRDLVQQFNVDALPERVIRAFFYHEYIHQLFYVDARWPMAVTGLESLVHTDRERSTRQFVARLLGVQRELGVALMSELDLAASYDLRSRLAHGQALGGLPEPHKLLYAGLEALLRLAVRTAILSPPFAAAFDSDASIRAHWPL